MAIPQNLKQIIADNAPLKALDILDELFDKSENPTEQSEILAEKGKIFWRLNRRGEAISAYEAGAKLDPAGPCATLLEMSGSIMEFFNKDLLNP